MNLLQQIVKDFHLKFNHPVHDKPVVFTRMSQEDRKEWAKLITFRLELISEELSELEAELFPLFDDLDGTIRAPNHINVAAELADLIYVTMGLAVVLGIDIEDILMEIQRANISKEPNPGGSHLKPVKPSGWTPPDIRTRIQNQLKKKPHKGAPSTPHDEES
jgi:predicted HAD superfamily Cof-like phosphohydrolase